MARIAVAGFHHETNCFVAAKTDFAYFTAHCDRPPLVRGDDVIRWLADTSFALSGFLQTMDRRHEIVPLVWTSGGAGGLVTADAFERAKATFAPGFHRSCRHRGGPPSSLPTFTRSRG